MKFLLLLLLFPCHIHHIYSLDPIPSPPPTSLYYNSKFSSTFHLHSSQQYQFSYLDKTKFYGQICSDYISLGNYINSYGYFGCISFKDKRSNQYFSSDIHGILGLGFPSRDYPLMNIFSILTTSPSSSSILNSSSSAVIPQKIFSLILFPNSTQGILQIGGFDSSKSHEWSNLSSHVHGQLNFHQTFTVPVLNDCATLKVPRESCPFRNYRVGIQKIRFGTNILYDKTKDFEEEGEKNTRYPEMQLSGIIDSGTTCLILPSRIGTKKIYTNLYLELMTLYSSSLYSSSNLPSLYITLSSQIHANHQSTENFVEIEIPSFLYTLPYSSTGRNSICVLTIPEYPSLMILGDVFLEAAVVIHNLTIDDHPTLTMIPRKWESPDNDETLNRSSSHSLFDGKIHELSVQKTYLQPNISTWKRNRLSILLSSSSSLSSLSSHSVSSPDSSYIFSEIPLQEVLGIQYIVKIAIGTPPQENIPVILDTGSSDLVIITHGLSTDVETSLKYVIHHRQKIIYFVLLFISLGLIALFSFFQKSKDILPQFVPNDRERIHPPMNRPQSTEYELVALIPPEQSLRPS